MLDVSNIPAWSTADSSPNEHAILRRARRIRQGKYHDKMTKKTATAPTNNPTKDLSSWPLSMAALGRGEPRSGAVLNRGIASNSTSGIASKIICLLMIVVLLLDIWHPHHNRQNPKPTDLRAITIPNTTSASPWTTRDIFRMPAFLPKTSKPFSRTDVALCCNSTVNVSVPAMLPPHHGPQIKSGWKGLALDVLRDIDRTVIAPATPKIDSAMYSNAAGIPAHYFVFQDLF